MFVEPRRAASLMFGLVVASVAQDAFPQDAIPFEVVVVNRSERNIRFKRIGDGEEEHAFADIAVGDSQNFNLNLVSGQVFAAFDGGEVIGVYKLNRADLRRNGGIQLTATKSGLVAALKPRKP